MKFLVYAADESFPSYELEINTMKELQELYKKYNEQLIVDFETNGIMVYNDYIE